MAKKHRPAARAVQKTALVQQDKKTESRRAVDGFINTLAYLGEASELNKANDYERHSITHDYETLTVMYRENWLAKRIIDTPCEDMTRAWYTISSELEQDKLDELAKLEAKHNIKQEITNMLRWARLYGGAAAVMVIKDQEDMLDQPMDYDTLVPGCFRGLIVVDRIRGLYPSLELEDDMDDPEFGYPKYYDVILDDTTGESLRIHHSRMLMARGRMLPIQEEINEEYWGASEIEHVYEELQKRNATSANIAQLVFQANVSAMRIGNFGEALAMGTEDQKRKVMESIFNVNRIKNSFGLLLMGNEDSYEQHPYSFAGIAEVYESFMLDMAGAAEIPATKLFGRSPQGMNATGESDMKNYYEMLAQLQERNLRPAIEKLLPVMAMSLWGVIPEDMEIVFEPLMTTTPDQRADIMTKQAGAIIQAFSTGLISQKTALLELQEQGKSIGAWTNITDEDIENAEEEVDSGEEMQDPMGIIGPGGPGAGGPPPGGPEGGPEGGMEPEAQLPEQGESLPEEEEDDGLDLEKIRELKERIRRIRKQKEEETEDGGPGSGPRPGYHKNGASLAERAKFMADPTEGMTEPKRAHNGPTGSKAQVAKQNRERQEWSNLTMHQKIQGNAEQERHIRKMKQQVMKAAAKGDLETARAIVKKNRHYWSNDPDSAQKVQSETLKRQKAVKSGFLNDLVGSLKRILSRGNDWSESDHPRGQPGNKGQFVSKEGGGSGGESSKNEEKSSSGTVANSPQAGYNTSKPSKYFTGTKKPGHVFPQLKGGTEFSSADHKTFRDAVVEAQESYSDAEGWRVSPHDEYHESDKCFTSRAGSTTCVDGSGDIVSVCKMNGSDDRAGDLLEQAIANGGKKLDAYGPGLFRLYTSHGFEPCSWCEWDDQYAPGKWKKANSLPDDDSWHGIPDDELIVPREPVIFYRYTGNKAKYNTPQELNDAYNGFLNGTKSAGTDYDAAYDQRDKKMEG